MMKVSEGLVVIFCKLTNLYTIPLTSTLSILIPEILESHSSVHLVDTQPLREAIDAECMLTNNIGMLE